MASMFRPSTINKIMTTHPTIKNLTRSDLTGTHSDSDRNWLTDPAGTGLRSTQQIPLDWSDFSKHCFFNSAESKVNSAYDRIINYFPYDGSKKEFDEWLADLSGWEKYIYDLFPKSRGYMTFYSYNTRSIEIIDKAGYLFPVLSKDRSNQSVIGSGIIDKGFTIEFWLAPATGSEDQGNQVIFQKLGSGSQNQGVSVFLSASNNYDASAEVHFILSSGSETYNPSSVNSIPSDSNYLHVSASILKGQFNHIAGVYDKGLSDSLQLYINGNIISGSSNFLEIGNMSFIPDNAYIGSGSAHVYRNKRSGDGELGFAPTMTLTGSVDEFRVWNYPRPKYLISSSMDRPIYSQDGLVLYFKFNEPTGSYDQEQKFLDYSGKGIHGTVAGINKSTITERRGAQYSVSGGLGIPMIYEDIKNCPVLFPDYPLLYSKNVEYLRSASMYDANNPNIITRLVPQHFFERERDENQSLPDPSSASPTYKYGKDPFPRAGKMPPSEIMGRLLFMWASFFDDIKLYIDTFRRLIGSDYDPHEAIPPALMHSLASRYGFELPNIFENSTPGQFQGKEDINVFSGISEHSLQDTLHIMWRRFLVELPHIIRGKGTLNSIKMLMNSFGIDPDSNFRIREFGGFDTMELDNKRKIQSKAIKFMNFTGSNFYLTSSKLSAFRHAPGYPYDESIDPDAVTNPSAAAYLSVIENMYAHELNHRGIPSSNNNTDDFRDLAYAYGAAATERKLTSASWAWEGNYIFDTVNHTPTQSLFRLHLNGVADGNRPATPPIFNLLAYSGSDYRPEEFGLRAVLCSSSSQSNTDLAVNLVMNNVNIFDGTRWYINVNNIYFGNRAELQLNAIQAFGDKIYQEYSTSSFYTLSPSENPLLDHASNHDDCNPDGPIISIGSTAAFEGSHAYLQNTSNNGTYDCFEFGGKIGSMRFWTKALSGSEISEHSLSPQSVGTNNPFVNYNFVSTIGSYNIATSSERLTTSSQPNGSWERLRGRWDLNQVVTKSGDGSFEVVDMSQNNLTLGCTANIDTSKDFIVDKFINYSIMDSYWDSPGTTNKIRINNYLDERNAERENVHHGILTSLDPTKQIFDDKRFSIETSVAHPLNEDIVSIFSNLDFFNEVIGGPEHMFATNYSILEKFADRYFNRLDEKIRFNQFYEFFKWFDQNFGEMIDRIVPRTTEFLGVNFVIESHMLERHKLQYKQADVHIDINSRLPAIEPPPELNAILGN